MMNGSSSPMQICDAINFALGTKYFDIKNRLKLDFTPKCLLNFEYCNEFHKNTKVKKLKSLETI